MVATMKRYQGMGLEQFTVRPYRSARLREYRKRMSQDNVHVLVDDNVKDMLQAQGYHIEDAPRSVYKYGKLYDALSGYAPGKAREAERTEWFRAGVALARSCFCRKDGIPKLNVLPMTPESLDLITSNPTGSAGLTAYGCTKAEAKTRALERGLQTLQGVKAPEPCLAFARTQFNDKTRLVWGYPYSMTLIEGIIAYSLNEVFKGGSTPMAFSMASGALGAKLRVASYHRKWAYSVDMSQYDATISADLIHQAFQILRTWYDMEEIEPISQKSVGEIFDLVERYFICTPIVMPDGFLYLGKRHGVPSGSFFTQMVDSIVNVIICGTMAARYSLNVSKREVFVLGDDLMFWSNRRVDLDVLAKFVNDAFGVKMHGAEKSAIYRFDEPVHFLGRIWSKGIPGLEVEGILKRMVFPERFRKYSFDVAQRARQVRLLILSYAAVYYEGWSIARDLLGTDLWYRQGGEYIDGHTYITDDGDLVPYELDHLTGLQRYLRKYGFHHGGSRLTTTALQFWL